MICVTELPFFCHKIMKCEALTLMAPWVDAVSLMRLQIPYYKGRYIVTYCPIF